MPPKITLEAVATRRAPAFALLTLDVVRAFYDLLGIDPAFHAALQRALRDATLITRKEVVQALHQDGPTPTLAGFCANVEGAAGLPATEHLAWWLQRVFAAEAQTHSGVEGWMDLLRRCQREGEECWRKLPFPRRLANEPSTRFATALDRTEYKRRCHDLDNRPLSNWDLHMFASQLYDFDGSLEGFSPNPSTKVSLTVRAYQQYRFWAWALRALTPAEQTSLHEKALDIVRALELTWIKELVHPHALDIGL